MNLPSNIANHALKKDINRINIKWLGAKSNDDITTMLQQAFTYGDVVYVPQGTYRITNTVTIPRGKTLLLEGENVRKDWDCPNAAQIVLDSSARSDGFDGFLMEDGTTLKGGIVSAKSTTPAKFDGKACVKVDFTRGGEKWNITIDTSLGSPSTGNRKGYGVNIDGGISTDDSSACNVTVKGFMYGFDIGVKTGGVAENCWFTTLFADCFIMNCTQAYDLVWGSLGKISGSIQPIVKTSPLYNAADFVNRPLVYIGCSGMILESSFWDMHNAANPHGLQLGVNAFDINIVTQSDFSILDERKYPYNNLNGLEVVEEKLKVMPSAANVGKNVVAGMQDNLLFGANKKFIVNINATNGGYINPAFQHGCFGNGDTETALSSDMTGLPTDESVFAFEITLDKARTYHGMGFSFRGGFYPHRYKMEVMVDGQAVYKTVKEGLTKDFFYTSIMNNFGDQTFIYDNSIVDGGFATKITKLKFTFYIIKDDTKNRALCYLQSLFFKDGTVNYLPTHGGTVYGDIDLNNNKLQNHVLHNVDVLTTEPTKYGKVILDANDNHPKIFNGSYWRSMTENPILPPSSKSGSRRHMLGMIDNYLFGGNTRHTLNISTTASGYVPPANQFNCINGGGDSTILSHPAGTPETSYSFEFIFSTPRFYNMAGFVFRPGYYPYKFKIEAVKDAAINPYETVLEGETSTHLNPMSFTDDRIIFDKNYYSSNVYKLKFTFYITNDQTKNRIYLHLESLFFKDGTSLNYLPTHGGTLQGTVDFNKKSSKNFVLDSGTTANRPTSPVVAQPFFDTSLKKPIYWSGTNWVDSNGTNV